MNEIYKTEIGKAVINALNGDDCLYHVSSDIKSDGKGAFLLRIKQYILMEMTGKLGHSLMKCFMHIKTIITGLKLQFLMRWKPIYSPFRFFFSNVKLLVIVSLLQSIHLL